ncbi:HAD domain-containing protein [Propionivibrio sp.]|uniref:HAD domain-containing protein n=1 Tax=Propionivibrio sp. TaxID=2212460 RepID=UPI003BF20026
MKAILFVDFDGVFHAMDSRDLEYSGSVLVVSDNPDLFQWAPLLWQIIEPYPVELVVHSSWRHLYPADELIARFPAAMQPRIAGITEGRERHQSILNYACMNDVKRFAVLDDSPEAFPGNWPNLIVCNSQRGINDADVLEKIRTFVETSEY